MDHNPFITRNNDLFMMLLIGAVLMITNTYLLNLSVQAQFLMALTVGFLAGLFMTYFYQSLEWALFFFLGVQLVAVSPFLLALFMGGEIPLIHIFKHLLKTAEYALFLISPWIFAIPLGIITQKLISGKYYEKTYF